MDVRGDMNCPIVSVAILQKHTEILKLLIEKGADVHSRDYVNKTPMFLARKSNIPEIIKLLKDVAVGDTDTDSTSSGTKS